MSWVEPIAPPTPDGFHRGRDFTGTLFTDVLICEACGCLVERALSELHRSTHKGEKQ